MSEEEKKMPVKTIVKGKTVVKPRKHVLAKDTPSRHVPSKNVITTFDDKHTPSRHIPSKNVITTFDDLMETCSESFHRFIESIGNPRELVSVEPFLPIREVTADLVDKGDKFIVHAEMPGVPKDNISIMLTSDRIEISAETGGEKEERDQDFVVRERTYSHVYKELSFPEEVIPENAESTLKDGVLEVIIPKKTPSPPPKKHKVAVK